MRSMAVAPWSAVLLMSLATRLGAQIATGTTTTFSGSATVSLEGMGAYAGGFALGSGGDGQRGMPYSLAETTTTVRTLADGTHITNVSEQKRMRDAEGRTRVEMYRSVNGNLHLELVHIADPVTRTRITLVPFDKTARIMHLPEPHPPTPEQKARMAEARAQAQAARQNQPEPPRPRPPVQTETLPPQTIAGVYAEGRRITRVIPVGLDGNDREIRTVTETWTSPDLHIDLQRTTDDPQMGKSTTVVTSLERGQPDPALFQVPPDYKVIDTSANALLQP